MKKLFLIIDLISGVVVSIATLPICIFVLIHYQDKLHLFLSCFVLFLTFCSDYLGIDNFKNRIKEIKDI